MSVSPSASSGCAREPSATVAPSHTSAAAANALARHPPDALTLRRGRVCGRQQGPGLLRLQSGAPGGSDAVGTERSSPGRRRGSPGVSSRSVGLRLVQEAEHASRQVDQAGQGNGPGGGYIDSKSGWHGLRPPPGALGWPVLAGNDGCTCESVPRHGRLLSPCSNDARLVRAVRGSGKVILRSGTKYRAAAFSRAFQ